MTRRAAATALILALSGCSLFGGAPTPQQQFLDALNRGNSAQASQIWLGMTPDDRDKFRRGEGMTPAASSDEVTKLLNEQGVDTNQGQLTIGPHTGAACWIFPLRQAQLPLRAHAETESPARQSPLAQRTFQAARAISATIRLQGTVSLLSAARVTSPIRFRI